MSCQTYSTSMTALSRTCVGCSIGLRTARRPSTGYRSWLVSWRIAKRSSLQVRPWRICPHGLGKHKSSAPVKERLQLDALSNTTMSPFLFHFVENSTAVWLGNQLIWVRSLIPPFVSCLRFGDSSRARRTGSGRRSFLVFKKIFYWSSPFATLCRTSNLLQGQPRSHLLRCPQIGVLFAVLFVDCEEWLCILLGSLPSARHAIVCILFSLEQSRVVDGVIAEFLHLHLS